MDLIKDLRARTGSPIKDCKKALEDSAGDMDNALDWLRKKGLAAASKKAARSASNGLIGCLCDADRAVLVEVGRSFRHLPAPATAARARARPAVTPALSPRSSTARLISWRATTISRRC